MALSDAVFHGFKRAQPDFVDSLAIRLQQLLKPTSVAMSSAGSSVATKVGEDLSCLRSKRQMGRVRLICRRSSKG
jgi:hypothetical protein